jgi:aspartate beta-hydroxylase
MIAREQVREGRPGEAEQSFRRVLGSQPENAEALKFLGNAAQARGEHADAVTLLSRAAKADPADAGILVQLGTAYRAADRLDAARYVLERAVRLSGGRHPYARLTLANVLELDQRPDLALLHYHLALSEAQQARRWSDDDRNVPGLAELAEHARQYVAGGRRAWFGAVLGQQESGAAAERRGRLEKSLALYLEGRAPAVADPRQRPGFMYVPEVASAGFLDDTRLAWLAEAARLIAGCAGELEACVTAAQAAGQPVRSGAGRVSILQRGVLQYEARGRTPQLQRVLNQLPLARVPHFAPDAEIVALNGAGRLPPCYGRTNSLCAVIFNPGKAALEVIVGREKRVLAAGATLVVDPTFGLEYAYTGAAPARALSVEVWHPDLSEPEREALGALFAAAIDFDTRLQELR